VFEIISPGNTVQEMGSKFQFYQKYGVQEYYVYNPHRNSLEGWYRKNNLLEGIKGIQGWISPNLGIKFELLAETLAIYGPDGEKFYSFVELDGLRQEQKERAEQAEKTIDEAINRMFSMGMTIEQIAEILGRNLTEINDKLN